MFPLRILSKMYELNTVGNVSSRLYMYALQCWRQLTACNFMPRHISFAVPKSYVGALQTPLFAVRLYDVLRRTTEASPRRLSRPERRTPGRYAEKTGAEALSKVWLRVSQFGVASNSLTPFAIDVTTLWIATIRLCMQKFFISCRFVWSVEVIFNFGLL